MINSQSIPCVRAPITAGAENNQLADSARADMLSKRGILYAPDFVINAGEIIEIHHKNAGSMEESREHIARTSDTLTTIFELSQAQQVSTITL